MSNPHPIHISVPGTSANLGPGYDILGMAWKLYNEFSFRFENKSYSVMMRDGSKVPFSEKEDLVLSSYKKYFELFLIGKEIPPYQCKMRLNLPMKGGLGSSASAVVAGFCLARELHKQLYKEVPIPSESRFLYELARIEGHPDNTSPAYLGGYVLSYFNKNEEIHYFKKKFPGTVSCFLLCPEVEISTHESRANLPKHYSTEDMVFNMTRIATWMQFFESGKFGDLLLALEDRIHTPYRLKPMVYIDSLIEIITKKQMGFCLSGSGPALLLFMPRKKVSMIWNSFQSEVAEVMKSFQTPFKLFPMKPDHNGIIIKRW